MAVWERCSAGVEGSLRILYASHTGLHTWTSSPIELQYNPVVALNSQPPSLCLDITATVSSAPGT